MLGHRSPWQYCGTYSSSSHCLLAFFIILMMGCSDGRPARVPVSGEVLIDGKPLKSGYIRFVSAEHRPSQGYLDVNGRFTLSCFEDNDGAVIGEHKIEIRGTEMVNPQLMRWHAPKKYADQQTSGLVQEITGPTDKIVINLTWEGGQPFDEKVELPGGSGMGSDGKY